MNSTDIILNQVQVPAEQDVYSWDSASIPFHSDNVQYAMASVPWTLYISGSKLVERLKSGTPNVQCMIVESHLDPCQASEPVPLLSPL